MFLYLKNVCGRNMKIGAGKAMFPIIFNCVPAGGTSKSH